MGDSQKANPGSYTSKLILQNRWQQKELRRSSQKRLKVIKLVEVVFARAVGEFNIIKSTQEVMEIKTIGFGLRRSLVGLAIAVQKGMNWEADEARIGMTL